MKKLPRNEGRSCRIQAALQFSETMIILMITMNSNDKKQHLVKLMCNFVAYTFETILSTQFWVNCRCMYRKQTPKFVEQPDCTAQCAIVMVVSSYRGSIFPWRVRIGQRLLCTSGFHFCILKNDKKMTSTEATFFSSRD